MIDDGRPIFLQIAELIENQIIDGDLAEDEQAPSTNEIAVFHGINPATAAKGMTLLVENGVLYKRRGIGMFVAHGARERLVASRRRRFRDEYVSPLVTEAGKLGYTIDQLTQMVRQEEDSA